MARLCAGVALEELVAAVVGLLPRRGAVGLGVLRVAVAAELASVQHDSAAARPWAEPAEQLRVGRGLSLKSRQLFAVANFAFGRFSASLSVGTTLHPRATRAQAVSRSISELFLFMA